MQSLFRYVCTSPLRHPHRVPASVLTLSFVHLCAARAARVVFDSDKKNIFWRCSNKKWENTGKMFTGCSDIVLHCEIHIRSFLIVQYLTVKLYHIYQYIIVYNMYIDIICFEFERLCCYWILLQCQWANLEDQDGGAVKVHPQDVLHLMCHL